MGQFAPKRSRDAYPVIRGFVYQVDLTIDRWLGLAATEILELECGEDIDTVARVVGGDDEAERRLEQIKHRTRGITLRSPEAIEAVANAIEHFESHKSLRLSFQFTTNATARVERPSTLGRGIAAIAAWEEVRLGIRNGLDGEETLSAIKALLASCVRPPAVPESVWSQYRAVVEAPNIEPLRRVVHDFSWCTRVPNPIEIKHALQLKLLSRNDAQTRSIAEKQYQLLFIHVLDLLTKRGPKRLSPEDLKRLLSVAEPDRDTEARISVVFGRLDKLTQQVEAIGMQQESDRRHFENRIDDLAKKQGITAAVGYVAATPTLKPGTAPILFSRRRETVASLVKQFGGATWLELNGTIGVGKSELARCLAESLGEIGAWIDFRGLQSSDSCITLDAAVRTAAGEFAGPDRRSAYRRFASKYRASVIVADDIPVRRAGDPFVGRFLDLISACHQCGVRIISTSLSRAPIWLFERLDQSSYVIRSAPPFADTEVLELLRLYSAPPSWSTQNLASTLNNVTGGHPTLLIAGIRFLKARNWRITHDDFLKLVRGEYPNDTRHETIGRLLEQIADSETRALLYRANFAITRISEKDFADLAAVEKPISRPKERLEELLDLCIQQSPAGKLRVSPLFKALGTSDVPSVTAKGCNAVLGQSIMSRKSVGITDAAAAVTHFLAADEYDRAALVLIRSVMSLNHYEGETDGGLLPIFWPETPIPEKIDLGLRIILRANQAVLFDRLGKSPTYFIDDMESLARDAREKDSWAVLSAAVTSQLIFADIDVRRANRFLLCAFRGIPNVKDALGERWAGMPDPEQLLWLNATKITKLVDLDDWIATIDALTAQGRKNLFSAEIVDATCWHLANRIWITEADRQDGERDWAAVFDGLGRLGEAGRRWGQPVIEACAIRGQIVVRSEYENDFPSALSLATAALESNRLAGPAAYPIRDIVGDQYRYQEHDEDARHWLEQALTDADESWPQQRINTLVHLARISDPSGAVSRLLGALSVASNDVGTAPLTLVRLNGELGFAYFADGQPMDSLRACDRALSLLFELKDENDREWRATTATLGHYLGYISNFVLTGKPPEAAVDGSAFTRPRIGMLATVNLDLAEWLKSSRLSFLTGMVAAMAEKVGEDEISERRALESLDLARVANELPTIASVGARYSVGLIVADRLSEALDVALQAGAAADALSIIEDGGGDVYATDRTSEQILGPKPSVSWGKIESRAISLTVFPILLRLATHKVNGSPNVTSLAQEVISAIDIILHTASERELWESVRMIFWQTFIEKASGSSLAKFGTELTQGRPRILRILSYLASTVQEDLMPKEALIGHLIVFSESGKFTPVELPVYRRVVLPFLEAYWRRIFNEQSFRFTPPALYRDMFAAAVAEPIERRAQKILHVAFQGFRVAVPEKYRSWFEEGD